MTPSAFIRKRLPEFALGFNLVYIAFLGFTGKGETGISRAILDASQRVTVFFRAYVEPVRSLAAEIETLSTALVADVTAHVFAVFIATYVLCGVFVALDKERNYFLQWRDLLKQPSGKSLLRGVGIILTMFVTYDLFVAGVVDERAYMSYRFDLNFLNLMFPCIELYALLSGILVVWATFSPKESQIQ